MKEIDQGEPQAGYRFGAQTWTITITITIDRVHCEALRLVRDVHAAGTR
jgi:hypothetical protein